MVFFVGTLLLVSVVIGGAYLYLAMDHISSEAHACGEQQVKGSDGDG